MNAAPWAVFLQSATTKDLPCLRPHLHETLGMQARKSMLEIPSNMLSARFGKPLPCESYVSSRVCRHMPGFEEPAIFI